MEGRDAGHGLLEGRDAGHGLLEGPMLVALRVGAAGRRFRRRAAPRQRGGFVPRARRRGRGGRDAAAAGSMDTGGWARSTITGQFCPGRAGKAPAPVAAAEGRGLGLEHWRWEHRSRRGRRGPSGAGVDSLTRRA